MAIIDEGGGTYRNTDTGVIGTYDQVTGKSTGPNIGNSPDTNAGSFNPVGPSVTPTNPTVSGIPIQQFTQDQVNNPNLAPGTQFVPVTQSVQNNELMNVPNLGAAPQANTTTATSTQVDPNATGATATGQKYDATTVGNNAAQMDAAQMEVTSDMTVKGQLEKLQDFDQNSIPAWAKGAARAAKEAMAARGLGSSSIAGGAIATALIESALPIAAADAQTYFQTGMANLTNEQQTRLANLQARQQSLLSDQAAANAAKQFNATNEQQASQFFASLMKDIMTQNAARLDAMQQFNAKESNAQEQFNTNIKDQREKFNLENQRIVEQSNVTWRRQINTANTAAENAAMQANTQNLFNLSAQAQANIWQQWRDEAAWAFQAAENDKSRAHNLAIAALQRSTQFDILNKQQKDGLFELIGEFAVNLVS